MAIEQGGSIIEDDIKKVLQWLDEEN